MLEEWESFCTRGVVERREERGEEVGEGEGGGAGWGRMRRRGDDANRKEYWASMWKWRKERRERRGIRLVLKVGGRKGDGGVRGRREEGKDRKEEERLN